MKDWLRAAGVTLTLSYIGYVKTIKRFYTLYYEHLLVTLLHKLGDFKILQNLNNAIFECYVIHH